MRFLKVYALIAILMPLLYHPAFSQQTDLRKEQQLEELIESLSSSEDGSSESSLLLEDLHHYTLQPIFINLATEEELLRLNLLNFKQVREIVDYRQKYGGILTLKELTILGDFDQGLLTKLESLVRFDKPQDSIQSKRDKIVHQSILARVKQSLPAAVGYSSQNEKPPAYGGKPYGYFARYRAECGTWLEMGLTTENDGGEDFFRQSNKGGFDFVSGFICWNGKGIIRKVVAGDYHLRFGQGINLWSGGGVTYVSDLSSMMRSGEGVRPYSSTDENLFFRGTAVQLAFKSAKFSLFYSNKRRDANLDQDSVGNSFITSFRMDGLHRTISEISDEKDVSEQITGGYGDFRFNKWRFGILACFQKFGLPVSKGNAPYKSQSFEGVTNGNLGLDYHLILNQISFFGEVGMSKNLKPAVVNGMVWKLHPQLSISMLYRYYDPAFHTSYAGAFAEGSGGKNEEGLYTAFEYFPFPKVKLCGQADLFFFPWMSFQTISPAHGQSFAFQEEVAIRSNLTVYLHARFVHKPKKVSGSTGIPEQSDESTSKWRLHGDWKVNDHLQFRSRFEFVHYKYQTLKENGGMVYQDMIYTVSPQLKFWLRLALYSTEGYNSRVYSYENDLLYYFSIPEFHGKGARSYLNMKWQPCKLFALYLKGGYTWREGVSTLGSGNDTTPGDHRFDVRGEVYLRF